MHASPRQPRFLQQKGVADVAAAGTAVLLRLRCVRREEAVAVSGEVMRAEGGVLWQRGPNKGHTCSCWGLLREQHSSVLRVLKCCHTLFK